MSGWLTLDQYRERWSELGDDDPYFRPEFLAASALAAGGEPAAFGHGGVLYPFLVRPLPDGRCDLTTAYGFGGPSGQGDWRAAFLAACRERGVVSEFVRFHPLRGNQRYAGDDVSVTPVQEMVVLEVDADDDELVRRMVPQARNKLRKAGRAGLRAEPGRDLERFWRLYTDAMRELDADPSYLFQLDYFRCARPARRRAAAAGRGHGGGPVPVWRRGDALLPVGVHRRGPPQRRRQPDHLRGHAHRP